MEKRINQTTGKTEYKIAPQGLPEIWVASFFCDRCKEYEECLGFDKLSDKEWAEANSLIKATNDLSALPQWCYDKTLLGGCKSQSAETIGN